MSAQPAAPAAAPAPVGKPRRDRLLELEKEAQQKWIEKKTYELDAPRIDIPKDAVHDMTLATNDPKKFPTSIEKNNGKGKWLVTFPYPYMNGRLHLGHGFSLTKAEFSARFRALEGRKVLFPFAFHCTGMPICAAAQKLEKQLKEEAEAENEEEGEGEGGAGEVEEVKETTEGAAAAASSSSATDNTAAEQRAAGVFKTKKGKLANKSSGATQSKILKDCGVPDHLIGNFVDPYYWLGYFPPHCVSDLMSFGSYTDWRRSFITTDANPYYDKFIRWQFRILKKENCIKFGKREAIIDPLNGQPCGDHDRSSGEGVGPQAYTLIKLEIQRKSEVPEHVGTDVLEEKILKKIKEVNGSTESESPRVYYVAATLRPETMPGQTNCFVLSEGEYGVYLMKNGEVYICGSKSAVNLLFQDKAVSTEEFSKKDNLTEAAKSCIESSNAESDFTGFPKVPFCYMKITGKELIGAPLSAPLAKYKTVYTLPMLGISMAKGTGIVTSVPADAPDDLAALRDLQTKEKLRNEHGVKLEWCDPEKFPVVNIINIPEFGDCSAVFLCDELKITSQKDKDKLKLAKDKAYLKGFHEGKLITGPFTGKMVSEAKDLCKKMMIESDQAVPYYEPEKEVIARSGAQCLVAFCDQWYLDYSDKEWTKRVSDYLEENNIKFPNSGTTDSEFDGYGSATRNGLIRTTEWMKEWACSRTFGLGTKLPWDESWVIESLSDSTIYMAYYAIAHLLQGGLLNGKKPHSGPVGTDQFIPPGPLRIKPEDLSDAVFDYIFDRTDFCPTGEKATAEQNPGGLSKAILDELRNEFQFWYPCDLRCSGKDLIQNHLTMSLFNHAAIWKNKPQYWPKGFFANGHVQVDNMKMSKSKGNFMTLLSACEEYSADVVRLACADAGDTLEDANFSTEIANQSILRFTALEEWSKSVMKDIEAGKTTVPATKEKGFIDKVFENELIHLTENAFTGYERCMYKDALKYSWYEMENIRKSYLNLVGEHNYHPECIIQFLKVQAIILSPIAPHFCDHLWSNILKQSTLVAKELWPKFNGKEFDKILHRQYEVLEKDLREIRMGKINFCNEYKKKNKKDVDFSKEVNRAVVYVAKDYKDWQQTILKFCQTLELTPDEKAVKDSKGWAKQLMTTEEYKSIPKQTTKLVMPFASYVLTNELSTRGKEALDLKLPFDEKTMLEERKKLIASQLGFSDESCVEIRASEEGKVEWDGSEKCSGATPAKPTVQFGMV